MNALKEMLILALLAPFAPVLFVLGLFEVKWVVRLMNQGVNLSYVPSREELNLLEAMVEREKAANRRTASTSDDSFGPRFNPDSGLPLRNGIDANGFKVGGPLNDFL